MSRRPFVVLHVVAPAPVGGLERVVQGLAVGHRRRGHDVHVAAVTTPDQDAAPFIAPLDDGGVAVHPVCVPARGYLQEHAAIGRLCRRLAPDVVHTHGYRPDVVAASAARDHGVARVTTVHGFTSANWRLQLYERIQLMVLPTFDAVVAVSRALARKLARRGVRRERLHLVPNAWAETRPPLDRTKARQALELPPDDIVVGWVGRLSSEKGPDLMVDALAQLGDVRPILCLIGDGPEREALEARATRYGIAGRIRWCGIVPDAGRLFTAFDVFALCSRTEGTPIVLFEAMAAGTPIVATAVGGVPEVLSSDTAFLVSPADPAALAQALRTALCEPQRAAGRAAAATARLRRRYAPEPWLDAYELIYRRVRRTTEANGTRRAAQG